VVFAGGRFTIADTEARVFADNLFGTLAKIRTRIPDMVLVHGGDSHGVDRFAASWAESQKVPQIVFHLERRHGNRAGFVRAERMLDLKPACVVALQGSGVLERLVDMARQRSIPVVDRRGPLCTRPEGKRAA
jgi:predicted transcriptional regulator